MNSPQMDRPDKAAVEHEEASFVTFQSSHGVELRATPVRITRYLIIFEAYNPGAVLQASEALTDFQIVRSGSVSYQGRAIIRKVIHTGAVLVCEATLEDGWLDVNLAVGELGSQWSDFLEGWRKI